MQPAPAGVRNHQALTTPTAAAEWANGLGEWLAPVPHLCSLGSIEIYSRRINSFSAGGPNGWVTAVHVQEPRGMAVTT